MVGPSTVQRKVDPSKAEQAKEGGASGQRPRQAAAHTPERRTQQRKQENLAQAQLNSRQNRQAAAGRIVDAARKTLNVTNNGELDARAAASAAAAPQSALATESPTQVSPIDLHALESKIQDTLAKLAPPPEALNTAPDRGVRHNLGVEHKVELNHALVHNLFAQLLNRAKGYPVEDEAILRIMIPGYQAPTQEQIELAQKLSTEMKQFAWVSVVAVLDILSRALKHPEWIKVVEGRSELTMIPPTLREYLQFQEELKSSDGQVSFSE